MSHLTPFRSILPYKAAIHDIAVTLMLCHGQRRFSSINYPSRVLSNSTILFPPAVPKFSHAPALKSLSRSYSFNQTLSAFTKSARFSTTQFPPPPDMIEQRFGMSEYNPLLTTHPRATQYQPKIVNSLLDPPPGTPLNTVKYLWIIGLAGLAVAITESIYEINAYYKQHGHRYENGWDVFHYHNKKATYYE